MSPHVNGANGYALDAKREFWTAAGKLRAEMDAGKSFHEQHALACEGAALAVARRVDILWIDRLCAPWFE